MRMCIVATYYFDRDLDFWFGVERKQFPSVREAKDYMDALYPIGDDCYSLDGFDLTRCKIITAKYMLCIEFEIY